MARDIIHLQRKLMNSMMRLSVIDKKIADFWTIMTIRPREYDTCEILYALRKSGVSPTLTTYFFAETLPPLSDFKAVSTPYRPPSTTS